MNYIIEKLKEPSTWRGIIWIATAFGLVLEPEQKEAVAAFGMAFAGLIGVFVEKGNAHTEEEIVDIVKQEQEKTVEKIMKGKTNAKTKKPDADNFFND